MPLDAVCLSALTAELQPLLTGAKVEKVRMPERDTILLSLHTNQGNRTLLLSAGTGDARVHFTRDSFENPAQPPMFCMLLRKYLIGALLTGLTQEPDERAVYLHFSCRELFGDDRERMLALELMGRYANLIFVDSDGIILDCLRRIDVTMSEKRQVLPGLRYELPPKQDGKLFFSHLAEEDLPLPLAEEYGMPADRWLMKKLSGISPLGCREICFAAFGRWDQPVSQETAHALTQSARAACLALEEGRVTPWLLTDESGRPFDFYCFPLRQYGSAMAGAAQESFSDLLGSFYSSRAAADRMRQKTAGLTKTIRNARDRTQRKLALQQVELQKTQDREELRRNGDIISANLYRMKRGDTVLRALDFYDPEEREKEIPLNPARSPQQNAADCYKKYAKAKNAEIALTDQIVKGRQELDYLNSVLEELSRAKGEKDLAEIRSELVLSGYVKENKRTDKKKPRHEGFLRFVSTTGMEIRVGKNNLQNDELTLHRSGKNDIWLHTQKIHGSHVVISCLNEEADDQTLLEAATLAALYSDGASDSKVPVDYTKIRYVKKPSGARPGMVIYTDYKTILVTPDEKLPLRLQG